MDKPQKILVAMSGGIDSSAVCLQLLDAGYEVVGMTMRVWDLPRQFAHAVQETATDGAQPALPPCPHGRVSIDAEPDFVLKARALAERLGIAHHVVDVRSEFHDTVARYFVDEYVQGRTPNPCVLCNRLFKFRLMQETADRLGCERMATGHYVRTEERDGHTYLLMGDDVRKDQSYFLWRVPQPVLRRCLFPLGRMEKPAVRDYLRSKGFPLCARQGESMEVCFVEGDYRDFLCSYDPDLAERVQGGWFVDTGGKRLGVHRGVPFYTVGQRKGLGIALGQPAYVLRLNAAKNTVVLGSEADLQCRHFLVEAPEVVCAEEFFTNSNLSVRVRYHSRPVRATVQALEDGRLLVSTQESVSAVTPGQSAVFYEGRRLVGGAIIASQRGLGAILEKVRE